MLTIPDDGAMSHRIRYQMPDEAENVTVMLGNGGSYEEVECDAFGKYITFSAPGNEVVVRVIEEEKGHEGKLWIPIAAGAGAAVAAGVITAVAVRRRKAAGSVSKKNRQKKPKKED